MTSDQTTHITKAAIDTTAVGITIGTVMSWLPAIAALFTIIWTMIRIYETETCKRCLGKLHAFCSRVRAALGSK